ncbi:hypothetical protein OO017_16750 [Pontibacter sp. M82]|uniref:VOC domain-containing protein n=1 Tax=Pontibacter anaerobius TaxID=2993940 RepID=A0ABT3RIF7_9BACT|nr:hypothetical protein [Pontibacter anaerobius]MCX2741611.1 hypothetical protein [Pontibacter anaerobius]
MSKFVVLDTSWPTSLRLWQTEAAIKPVKEAASYPIFRTPDAVALRQELELKGTVAEEMIKDDYVSFFFFYDPDGNVLETCLVHEERPGSSSVQHKYFLPVKNMKLILT